MPKNKKARLNYRCPVCLNHDADPYLAFDEKHKEYYCHWCAFAGDEKTILKYYGQLTARMPLLNKRIKL